jgi:hypothetical protein
MNTRASEVLNSLRDYGFHIPEDIPSNLYRVLKTKAALGKDETDANLCYAIMQRETYHIVGRFPGDAVLFNRVYRTLSSLETHDIFYLLNAANGERDLVVPSVLVEKFAEQINEGTRSVLVTECEKYGLALYDIIVRNPDVRFVLTFHRELQKEILSIVYQELDNVQLLLADIYRYGFIHERFDLIFSVPVFGGRLLIEGEDFISREPGMIATQNLLYHLNLDGKLLIVLPAKITFAGGSVAALRNYIHNNYKIQEISSLPAGLFVPYTSIRTYFFTFSTGYTDDVVVRQYISREPIRKTTPCTELILTDEELLIGEELTDLNGWNVDMVFSHEDDEILAFRESSTRKMQLKETATVFRGKAVANLSDSGNVGVINISDMTETGIEYSGLGMIEEEERKIARYALEEGDVLITARGTVIKTAVFQKQPFTCITSANINVIRPTGTLRGAYLKLFLDSPVGDKLLRSLQRGSTVVNLNYKDLAELEVPTPPTQTQDALITHYNSGLALYKQTLAFAEKAWQEVQTELFSKLY